MIFQPYEHSLNSKSKTTIIKEGRFLRYVNHTTGYRGDRKAEVYLEGSRKTTAVPIKNLTLKKRGFYGKKEEER